MMSEQELTELIKDWVMRNGHHPNSAHVNGDTDLIANGILDSMGFIELLTFVESSVGWKIDLSDLDPTEFTTIQGLSRSIVNSYFATQKPKSI